VIDCSRRPVAAWGELFSTASKARGARGAILDGMIRDRDKIEALGFAVFARGCRPTDSLGRVSIEEADLVVALAGVPVRSGDLVVADADGITVVPRERAEETVRLAVEKATTEDHARDLLFRGSTLADVWERFRVL
jgi:4-hydroxy-4-methyl-2-oxoglutarate aldolase